MRCNSDKEKSGQKVQKKKATNFTVQKCYGRI